MQCALHTTTVLYSYAGQQKTQITFIKILLPTFNTASFPKDAQTLLQWCQHAHNLAKKLRAARLGKGRSLHLRRLSSSESSMSKMLCEREFCRSSPKLLIDSDPSVSVIGDVKGDGEFGSISSS